MSEKKIFRGEPAPNRPASEVMGRATAEWGMHMKRYRAFDRNMRGVQGRGVGDSPPTENNN